MTIAHAFNQALHAVETYQLSEKKLIFMDQEGSEVLEFNRLPDSKVLLNDIWVVESIGGEAVGDKANAPRLEFNTSTMEIVGTDGCNNLKGKLTTLTNSDLVFGQLAGTRKLCADMTMPDKFNKILAQVRRYEIENIKLTLRDDQDNLLMVLRKTD